MVLLKVRLKTCFRDVLASQLGILIEMYQEWARTNVPCKLTKCPSGWILTNLGLVRVWEWLDLDGEDGVWITAPPVSADHLDPLNLQLTSSNWALLFIARVVVGIHSERFVDCREPQGGEDCVGVRVGSLLRLWGLVFLGSLSGKGAGSSQTLNYTPLSFCRVLKFDWFL